MCNWAARDSPVSRLVVTTRLGLPQMFRSLGPFAHWAGSLRRGDLGSRPRMGGGVLGISITGSTSDSN